MTIPVAFSVSEFNLPREKGRVLLNREPLAKCFDLNEAEGWADVWTQDADGRLVGRIPGTDEIAHHRVHGAITVECIDPALRQTLERIFPADRKREVQS